MINFTTLFNTFLLLFTGEICKIKLKSLRTSFSRYKKEYKQRITIATKSGAGTTDVSICNNSCK